MTAPELTCASAVIAILRDVAPDTLVVAANGHISRACHHQAHRPGIFYMLGSMGLAPSIALGAALARPDRAVVVLDGDGNALMGLGGLTMVGAWRPSRFLHVVLDNGVYASTGGQQTISGAVDWPALAVASGYASAERADRLPGLPGLAARLLAGPGPALLHVTLAAEDGPVPPRVPWTPTEIVTGFRASLTPEGTAA